MDRITQHPVLEFSKGREVSFRFEDRELTGHEGETIAAALHANGIRFLHESAHKHRPRGLFCAIGNCGSCLMKVNGIPNVRVCMEPLREGVHVERQMGNESASVDRDIEKKLVRGENIVETQILIVGGGPGGMCAALEAAKAGARVLLIERNKELGGQLVKQTHKFFGSEKQHAGTRGIAIADELRQEIEQNENIEVWTDAVCAGYFRDGIVLVDRSGVIYGVRPQATIVATGAFEKNLVFPNNDLPGIYGAGAVQTLMNVEGVVPGRTALMVGAGNIGLIVSYQLMQAGVDIAAVIEAAPQVGGYLVHANKLLRAGVPIMTRHTIKFAYGKDRVEGAVITELDEKFTPIPGTEREIKCDLICMAVGLAPLAELFFQAGCEMKFVPELSGYVPVIDDARRTSVPFLYAAGDSAGVEEASSAMLTGKLAGISAAKDLGFGVDTYEAKHADYAEQLDSLRPENGRIRNGILKSREGGSVPYDR